MVLVRNELTWGEEHAAPQAPDVRAWRVELESEPLGPLVETALARFCHDARHRAQSEPSCTLSSGHRRCAQVLGIIHRTLKNNVGAR